MQRMIPKRLGLKFQFTRRLRAAISSITSLADLPSDISIHATPTGRDLTPQESIPCPVEFQFTRPIRAAMEIWELQRRITSNFNSRDPYGPRSSPGSTSGRCFLFQFTRPIRAAILDVIDISFCHTFQFTRPIRAAIDIIDVFRLLRVISIHATHTGRDSQMFLLFCGNPYFNSRDPYGPRSCAFRTISTLSQFIFQFTRPIRAAMYNRRIQGGA